MKQIVCDRCSAVLMHSNKVHVYEYKVVKEANGKKYKPIRKDFDLCNGCRERALKFIGGQYETK